MRRKAGSRAWVLLLAVALAAAASALALATAPDLVPPDGLLYRTVFIGRDGAVADTMIAEPPGIDSRPVFIGRDGAVEMSSLTPPDSIDSRTVFVGRDGSIQETSVPAPSGLLNPGPFITRDGGVAPGSETLDPPPGLDYRSVFIGRDGTPGEQAVAAPAAGSAKRPLELRGVYPNPFNPAVEISFTLNVGGRVRVTVLDVRGRRVRVLNDGPLTADLHVLRWDGTDDAGNAVAAGSYLFRIETAGEEVTARGALVK
jgi:hypothetical protein